jgi:hypothetical protein
MDDDYMSVTATAIAPWGERTDVWIGTIPVWAWEDRTARLQWLKARRAVVFSEIGTSGIGWTVRHAAVAADG